MVSFVARRLGQGMCSVIGVTVLIFILVRVTGNPMDAMLPIEADEETKRLMARQLGLDRSWPEQFWIFAWNLLHGDLGQSIRFDVPVWRLFAETFRMTLGLVVPAFFLSIIVGIPLGVIAATSRVGVRTVLSSCALVGLAVPTFWLGILLIQIFSLKLGWLPAGRTGTAAHYVLPVITLAAFKVAALMRLVRSNMLDVLDTEFIKLARIKGVSEGVVIWKHALRNSLTSAASFMGVIIGVMIMGSVVVETVFAWPGTGRLIYTSILARDYPVVQGLVLITSLFIICLSMAMDIVHALLDPRIRR
jgi:peptide/nickel transport system permease protein